MDPSRAIQHEISSLKGAGRGWGPSRGVGSVDQAVTSGWVQPPQGSGQGLPPWGQLCGWGAGAAGDPMSVFCRDSTWREVRLELAGVTPAAAPQPCSPATLQRVSGGGAGYCSGGGGAEVGAGLRHLSDPHFLSSRTLSNPAPLVGLPPSVEGDRAGPWGSITGGGGARRAGPGQVHTAVLCSGMGGGWGLPKDPDWLPWRSGGTWSGVEEAALVVRPGPSCAESATAAAVPAGWGQGRKGCSPSPGTWGARG